MDSMQAEFAAPRVVFDENPRANGWFLLSICLDLLPKIKPYRRIYVPSGIFVPNIANHPWRIRRRHAAILKIV